MQPSLSPQPTALPLKVLDAPWEAPIGLAMRLAARNSVPVEWLLPKAAMDDDQALVRLAKLAGKSPRYVLRAAPYAVAPHLKHEERHRSRGVRARLLVNDVDLGRRRPPFPAFGRYCPRCLADDLATRTGDRDLRPWLRVWWLSQDIDACHEHGVRIETHEGPDNSWASPDWDGLAAKPGSPLLDVAGERWLMSRLGAASDPLPSFLDRFPPRNAQDTLASVGRFMALCGIGPPEDEQTHLTRGFHALKDGEASFAPVVEQLIVTSRRTEGNKQLRNFFWNFVRSQDDDAPKDQMREWIRDVVTAHVDKHRFVRSPHVLDRPAPPPELERFDKVAEHHGLSRLHAERSFHALGVTRLEHVRKALGSPVADALLDADEIDELVTATDEVTIAGVSLIIGAWAARHVAELSEWHPACMAYDGPQGPVYSRAGLISWRERLLDNTPVILDVPEGAATIRSLYDVGKRKIGHFGHAGIDRALRFIHEGRVRPLGRLAPKEDSEADLRDLIVPADKAIWRAVPPRAPFMRITEAMFVLRCPQDELMALVEAGLIKRRDLPTIGGWVILDRASVQEFARAYVRRLHVDFHSLFDLGGPRLVRPKDCGGPLLANKVPTHFYRRRGLDAPKLP